MCSGITAYARKRTLLTLVEEQQFTSLIRMSDSNFD